MSGEHPPEAPLFSFGGYSVHALSPASVPTIQRFFEANPDYFLTVHGVPPRSDEAQQEFEHRPPAFMPYSHQWFLGFYDGDDELGAFAVILSDFIASNVWHLGLFMLAGKLRRTGASETLYRGLESWMRGQGAKWIRLGVVEGNEPAERFWRNMSYTEVRKRSDVDTGVRRHTISVRVKVLADSPLSRYFSLVPRDDPNVSQ